MEILIIAGLLIFGGFVLMRALFPGPPAPPPIVYVVAPPPVERHGPGCLPALVMALLLIGAIWLLAGV